MVGEFDFRLESRCKNLPLDLRHEAYDGVSAMCLEKSQSRPPMFVESWRTAVAPYAAAAGRCITGAHGMVRKSYLTLYNQGEWWRATHEQYVRIEHQD